MRIADLYYFASILNNSIHKRTINAYIFAIVNSTKISLILIYENIYPTVQEKGCLHFKQAPCFLVPFVLAQVLVKGTVKDNLGEGVPGFKVQVKGTSQGTITDLDGNSP